MLLSKEFCTSINLGEILWPSGFTHYHLELQYSQGKYCCNSWGVVAYINSRVEIGCKRSLRSLSKPGWQTWV